MVQSLFCAFGAYGGVAFLQHLFTIKLGHSMAMGESESRCYGDGSDRFAADVALIRLPLRRIGWIKGNDPE